MGKKKNFLSKMFSGLMAALLVTFLLPAAALAAPALPRVSSTVNWQSTANLAYDALEIFPQEVPALTPRAGTVVNDTRTFDADLPPSTTVLFVIGGAVVADNTTSGEWQIGNSQTPIFVYEAVDNLTVISGTPAVGDGVRIVGKRTLAAGPIVAQYITKIDPAPQPSVPAAVTTAFLLNGTVTTAGASAWTVTPAGGTAVAFNILMDAGALGVGPTVVTVGLGQGSSVTVEYVTHAAPVTTTDDTTGVATYAVTLNGHLTGLGTASTVNVSFEWGTASGSYSNSTSTQSKNQLDSFSANLTGLSAHTTYYYRAKADGGGNGVSYGSEKSFTTSVITPVITTDEPDGVTVSSGTLHGNLTDLGSATTVNVSFEWGTTHNGPYPNATSAQGKSGPGTFNTGISGLASGTTYFYRAKADGGANGVGLGGEKSFTTAAPAGGGTTNTNTNTGTGTGTGGSGTSGTSGTSGSGSSGTSGTSGTSGGTSGGGPGPSSSSGSGSGGAVVTTTVTLSGMTSDKPLKVDNSGKSQDKVKLSNSGPGSNAGPGKTTIEIPAGTMMKSSSGKPVESITMTTPVAPPPPPEEEKVIVMQDMGPDGATFDPPLTMTMTFDPAALPAGVDKKDLVIGFWDGAKWVELDTTLDEATNTLMANVSHFTVFGILTGAGAPAPVKPPPSAPTSAAPPASATAPSAPESIPPQTNWALIIAAIGAAVVIVGVAVYAMQRKRS